MLFLKQVGADDRKVIKHFIFEQLERRFDDLIYSIPPDIEDYSNRGIKAAEAAASEEAAEEVEEIEEAEAVDGEGEGENTAGTAPETAQAASS